MKLWACGLLMLGVAWPALAQAADATAGKALLEKHCGRCHAVEATGASRLPIAPPLRDIYRQFAPKELQAELSQGMVSRHKAMPQIEFSEEDVAAILAYLYELARRQ